MTLTQLRYLVAIIDAGLNITLAAEQVNATQPGMSKQLRDLEDELGFKIFIRSGKRLDRLSAAGSDVVESARMILAEADNISAHAANLRGDVGGDLRILTTQTQAQYVLPPALKKLRERFPQVRVQLSLTGNQDGSRPPADFDLAVISAVEPPAIEGTAFPLYHWKRVLLVPAGHPFTIRQSPLTLEELSHHPLIGYETNRYSNSSVAQAFAEAGCPIRFAYATHESEVIKAYVRSGLGLGIVAEMVLGELPADLAFVKIDGLLPLCTAWGVVPKDRILRDYVLELLTVLGPHFSSRDIRSAMQFGTDPTRADVPDWAARVRHGVEPLRLADRILPPNPLQPKHLRIAAAR